MSVLDFASRVQKSVVFDPKFTGVKAKYSRRVENKEGERIEEKSVLLFVSPQGNYVASNNQIDSRINVIWAKTEDLKFDGEPFLPMGGDLIEYKVNGVLHKYIVASTRGMLDNTGNPAGAVFSYEDSTHGIIKINTLKQK